MSSHHPQLKFDKKLKVRHGPYLHTTLSVSKMMWGTALALLPAWVVSLVFFGWNSARITVLSIVCAVTFEYVFQKMFDRKVSIQKGHGFLIGFILALLLPPTMPLILVGIGALFSIVFGKELLGGLGKNRLHPVLVGYGMLFLIFPEPFARGTTISNALVHPTSLEEIWYFFLGEPQSAVVGAMVLALAIGGFFLVVKGWVRWEIPVCYLATLALGSTWINAISLGTIFSGIFLFAAFFILTEPATTPVTKSACAVFSVGAAMLSLFFLNWIQYSSASVVFSVLLMNSLVSPLDHFFCPGKSKRVRSPRVKAA
jgi:Na+-translocating ferredoxin:NAD+ oxidoreductase subunit D